MSRQIEYVCEQGGERLDRFLAGRLEGPSRSSVQRWIDGGRVTVDGQATKTSRRLAVGEVVRVTLPDDKPEVLEPWPVALSVLYEDADCAVVDKPAGMVVHPATSHRQDTLVNALLARYPEMMAMVDLESRVGQRPGIVHRLDKDTSGLIIVARHEAARSSLQRQFRSRTVEKGYLALVHGRLSLLDGKEGLIDLPIGRDPRRRQRMAVVEGGRRAVTRYTTRQFLFIPHGVRERYSLVEVALQTGRTHQIRVHMAYLGHPVVGDRVYGRRKLHIACPRQFLHAFRLGFHRPSDGQWIAFESPLPADLEQVLGQLSVVA
jgi:23S rRNA pseudouridine1911/1915/1917 synthase